MFNVSYFLHHLETVTSDLRNSETVARDLISQFSCCTLGAVLESAMANLIGCSKNWG